MVTSYYILLVVIVYSILFIHSFSSKLASEKCKIKIFGHITPYKIKSVPATLLPGKSIQNVTIEPQCQSVGLIGNVCDDVSPLLDIQDTTKVTVIRQGLLNYPAFVTLTLYCSLPVPLLTEPLRPVVTAAALDDSESLDSVAFQGSMEVEYSIY